MSNEPVAGLGHNKPPSDEQLIAQNAEKRYLEIFNQQRALINKADDLPEKIEEEEQAEIVGDYIKQLKGTTKKIEAARVAEKEPYLTKSRLVDGFFNKKKSELTTIHDQIKKVLAEWTRKKEAEERERIAREAEERRIKQEEEMRKAQEAECEAARIREEQLRKEREAAEAKAEKERKAREAAEARAERDRLAREAKEAEDKAEKERLKKEAEKAKEDAARLRQEAKEAREAEMIKEKEAKETKREAKATERKSDNALKESMRAEKQADRLEQNIERSAQVGSRVRGTQGSLTTVTKKWVGSVVNRDELDLETLRQHIPMDALEKAVNSYVRAGGRNLKGASIYEDDDVQVR